MKVMTVLGEKLQEAMEANYVWKFAKNKQDGTQEEIKLVDATDEQLKGFYAHCNSMLYNNDNRNPGRYTLLKMVEDQKKKCSVELYLRKIEAGTLTDPNPTPRYIYLDGLMKFMNNNRESFPRESLNKIPISATTGGLPKEFANLPISDVIDGCLREAGIFISKPITRSFIFDIGIWPTTQEKKELAVKYNPAGEEKTLPDLIRQSLGLSANIYIKIVPSGLSLNEFRAMLRLRSIEYYNMTTDQLITLRSRVLFKLENEIQKHIASWERRKSEIEKVAANRGISLE